MAKLRREIREMKTSRDTKRQERRRHEVPSVAIAGYTNAGKSSLLNRLTGAGVLVENALFATLDPTVRRAETPDGRTYTLADTVGFVRHLPTQLVEAFRSTLEEVAEADLILHVVDGSDADPRHSSRPSAPFSPTWTPTRCPSSWSSTRPTRPTRWCSTACAGRRSTASWSRPGPGWACPSCSC
jgi:50S ribosomal subunit-associated GTPase HflX